MTSRRQMLKSSLALAAGAVGFGAARKAIGSSASTDPPPVAPSGAKLPRSLTFTGRDVHAASTGRAVGHGPATGERTTLSGRLVDANGSAVGDFFMSSTAFESPFGEDLSAVESHTFRLSDGTIHGMGTAVPGDESVFAIVGGTGRYVGARGSYTARHMPIELGGDGSAAFAMTFTR
jgi:hypothetical protein